MEFLAQLGDEIRLQTDLGREFVAGQEMINQALADLGSTHPVVRLRPMPRSLSFVVGGGAAWRSNLQIGHRYASPTQKDRQHRVK